jgi:hypothetical protein
LAKLPVGVKAGSPKVDGSKKELKVPEKLLKTGGLNATSEEAEDEKYTS